VKWEYDLGYSTGEDLERDSHGICEDIHLETEQNHVKSQNIWQTSQDLNQVPHQNKSTATF
jgi:hypothetical protein